MYQASKRTSYIARLRQQQLGLHLRLLTTKQGGTAQFRNVTCSKPVLYQISLTSVHSHFMQTAMQQAAGNCNERFNDRSRIFLPRLFPNFVNLPHTRWWIPKKKSVIYSLLGLTIFNRCVTQTDACSKESCSWSCFARRNAGLYSQPTWAFWQASLRHISRCILPVAGSVKTTFNCLIVLFQVLLVKIAYLINGKQL
jgi:hypothetical protein